MSMNPNNLFSSFSRNSGSAQPKLRRTSDGTLHAFPADAPETDIERYQWRYDGGMANDGFYRPGEESGLNQSPAWVRECSKERDSKN